ncbi:hypothetical protein C8J57DRAFT_1114940 [Mycena rebaudengoi]|nr:hypothetical protein C8J57DRAFT_1114940 [Mycena rebaudengoi]
METENLMDTTPVAELQKEGSLWFSTEVVILQAGTRIFRVFAAILKEKSSVFADMFALPQPPTDAETLEGFPVIKLHDDPAEVAVFLRALFDSSFFMPYPTTVDSSHVLGILRLSHKYDVPYLRRRALQHLNSVLPTTLLESDADVEFNLNFTDDDKLGFNIVAIKVASEIGASWLLPIAYSNVCTFDIADIVASPPWHALGKAERTVCLVSYVAQMKSGKRVLEFLSRPSNCINRAQCNTARLRAHLDFDLSRLTDPIDFWSYEDWDNLEEAGMCSACLDTAKVTHAAARGNVWDEIPKIFGLPDWAQLREMRRAALGEDSGDD